MDLVLGRGAFARQRGQWVPWRQVNCMLEATPSDPKQYNLLSRPPMAQAYTYGSGPVHGVFWKAGLFGGAIFAVVGTTLYRDGVSLGTIDGTGPVSWAGGNAELCLTRGASGYSYDGATLAAIAMPGGFSVRAVHWTAGWFFWVRRDSGRFYWSNLNDGRTVGALAFATAESTQDELRDIKKTGDVFWMLGTNSGEAWILTGDPDLPLTRVVQRYIERGVRDTGCAEEIEGTVYFIANDGMVCVIQDAAVRVSDASLDEKIRQSITAQTFHYSYEGKVLFCMRLDSGTYALDLALANQPLELQTYGRANWAPKCAVNINAEPLFGDDTGPLLWAFAPDNTTDCGLDTFPRIFSAGAPLNTNAPIANVVVNGDAGETKALTGAAADPILEMAFSRDGGKTFSPWRASRWGQTGQYKRYARYGNCGMFGPPGFLAQFRLMQCAPLRVGNVRANESLAGRGR